MQLALVHLLLFTAFLLLAFHLWLAGPNTNPLIQRTGLTFPEITVDISSKYSACLVVKCKLQPSPGVMFLMVIQEIEFYSQIARLPVMIL